MLVLLFSLCCTPALAKRVKVQERGEPIAQLPEAVAFMEEMALRHQFDRADLARLFGEARLKESILKAMDRPAEIKPWREYRPLFVETRRIERGVRFWEEHEATLQRAEAQFGVPASVIVAIIGVETFYGRNTGAYRVVDALATLAFGYPKRAAYFRDELEQYLLLTREADIPPLSITGSYAGAMGIPQFMPSSYRNYGVDFDGDTHRDLWRNPVDAIGSVARYFQGKGWQPGAPVLAPATQAAEPGRGLANRGWGYRMPLKAWGLVGVASKSETEDEAMLLELAGVNGPEHWLAFENFYVITRYNHSFHYAMAVWELSQALEAARGVQRQD
ncbi:MAG: lytic murein transglycosylase B [Hydrogenophilales bacterium]|nr:lytic murein transglycosylase B [Hydrogenophilales bacterium]